MSRAVMQEALDALIGPGYYDTTQQRKAIAALRAELAKPDGWVPIESAPKDGECAVVYWMEDGEPRYDFDGIEEGSWAKHADHYDHYCMVAGHGMTGPKEAPPYTHWMPLPKAPA